MIDNIIWNKQSYCEFIKYLYSLQDLKYQQFHKKMLNDDISLIGIRTPLLKTIAFSISKNDYLGFYKYNNHQYYEEIILHGLIIGYLNISFELLINYINNFITYNRNWAINDIVCANMKLFKNNLDEGLIFINTYINSNDPYKIRFGLVILLDFYIDIKYIDKIFNISKIVKNNDYYVEMANAWLISICFIKYRDKAFEFLENKYLNKFTQNKAIQKIRESKRVSDIDKEIIKKFIIK